ncbi:nicotinate phosphoribosyltransferase [Amanita muscaria]
MSSDPPQALAVPRSILDTDLYKLTMQQAVLYHFPDIDANYRFTNRSHNAQFSLQCAERFLQGFSELALTPAEKDWLAATCPYLTQDYLDYLSSYRYKPEQVDVIFVPGSQTSGEFGNISIDIRGPWAEAIMWEVPLMACLSETYFQVVDTNWDYTGQEDLAFQKGKTILEAGCSFSEFGTRRRRSYTTQDIVMQGLMRASNVCKTGTFNGTSNVHLAHKYGVLPIGTIAHEWFMAVAALKGYENANLTALALWENVYYTKATLIALTDTFSTECFFSELEKDPERVQRWQGIRQDSGDPFQFGPRAKRFYESLNIDPSRKTLVYSDSLDVEKVLRIKAQCNSLELPQVAFGIGTFLTNDFRSISSGLANKSKPLNIVIKLFSVNGLPCIKISDDLTKNTGDAAAVENVKRTLHLPCN